MSLVKLSEKQKELIKNIYDRFKDTDQMIISFDVRNFDARTKIELKDLEKKAYIIIKNTSDLYCWYIEVEKRLLDYLENEKEMHYNPEPDEDSFVDYEKIEQLKNINNNNFDLSKLIQLNEAINVNYKMHYISVVAVLIRMILDHSYPCFGSYNNFSEVVAQYGGKSVKQAFSKLDQDARKIADHHAHSPISNKTVLPTKGSIDFKPSFHLFLEEIIKNLS